MLILKPVQQPQAGAPLGEAAFVSQHLSYLIRIVTKQPSIQSTFINRRLTR